MKKLRLEVIFACVFSVIAGLTTQAQSWQWARSANTPNYGEGVNLCTDPSGNIFYTGWYGGPTATFGSYTLTAATGTDSPVYVVKYDNAGNVLWAKGSTGNSLFSTMGICSDPGGNVAVAGNLGGQNIAFDTYTMSAGMFLVKYDPNGTVLWAKTAGGDPTAVGVSSDQSGNFYLTGYYSTNAVFGPYTLSGLSNSNVFLVKYDANGNELWASSSSGTNNAEPRSVSTNSAGTSWITGIYTNSMAFGTNTIAYQGQNAFITKFNSNGGALWAKSSSAGNCESFSVSEDLTGNAYVTGFYYNSLVCFGTNTLINSSLSYNSFLTKYDVNGNAVWARKIGGDCKGLGVSAKQNSICVTGSYFDTLKVGTYTFVTVPSNPDRLFIAEFDSNGNENYADVLSSGGDDDHAVNIDKFCNVYIASDFQGTLVVGSTTLVPTGYESPYLAKLTFPVTCQPLPSPDLVLQNFGTDDDMVFFPNPNKGIFKLKLEKELNNAVITVSNTLGQKIHVQKIERGMNTIELNVPEGLYHVCVTEDEHHIAWGKIIVE